MRYAFPVLSLFLIPALYSAPAQPPAADAKAAAEAEWKARLGVAHVSAGRLTDARTYCADAVKTAPSNALAHQCMTQLLAAERGATEQTLRAKLDQAIARDKLGQHDKALDLLAEVRNANPPESLNKRIEAVRKELAPTLAGQVSERLRAGWIFDVLVAMGLVIWGWLVLVVARQIWRYGLWSQRIGGHRNWTLLPIDDKSEMGVADLVLDAFRRSRELVSLPSEVPALLLLRPDGQGDTVAEVWRSGDGSGALAELLPAETAVQVDRHSIDLSDAIQDLQISIGAIKVNEIAKFFRSLVKWFNVGAPSISVRSYKTDSPKEIVIRLACSFAAHEFAVVSAATPIADGIDAAALTAERAVYKLITRMADGNLTVSQIDGRAAFQQGVALIERTTADSVGVGEERAAALKKAKANLEFAKTALADSPVLDLYSGIALALHKDSIDAAIERFEEIEDAPGADKLMRAQAILNQAVLQQRKAVQAGAAGYGALRDAIRLYDKARCVAPDSAEIQCAANFGRLSAISQMTADWWRLIGAEVGRQWLHEGYDFAAGLMNDPKSPFKERITMEMRRQAPKFYGAAATRYARSLMANERPVYLEGRAIRVRETPEPARQWCQQAKPILEMYRSEYGADSAALVDMAYAALLLRDYETGVALGREAMAMDPANQEAYYVAAENWLARNTADAPAEAQGIVDAYAQDGRKVTLPVFRSLIEDLTTLGQRGIPPAAAAAAA